MIKWLNYDRWFKHWETLKKKWINIVTCRILASYPVGLDWSSSVLLARLSTALAWHPAGSNWSAKANHNKVSIVEGTLTLV